MREVENIMIMVDEDFGNVVEVSFKGIGVKYYKTLSTNMSVCDNGVTGLTKEDIKTIYDFVNGGADDIVTSLQNYGNDTE